MLELTEKQKEELVKESMVIVGNVLKLHGRDMGKESTEEITILVNMFQEGVRYAVRKNKEAEEEVKKNADIPF